MLKAIIFDFDGVIADTEPIHLEAFRNVLRGEGIELTNDDYFNRYLAFDDKTLFREILNSNKRDNNDSLVNKLIEEKHKGITELFDNKAELFPGFTEFMDLINDKYVLAIASGALKAEIEHILNKYNLLPKFQNITSADEVLNCKPDPEAFLKALLKINEKRNDKINASECLVFEDSVHGVTAAKAAHMKCIAITNSYDENSLKDADIVVDSFENLNVNQIESIFNSE